MTILGEAKLRIRSRSIYKVQMREIKVLYSRKHGTIEASQYKCGTYPHTAKIVATFYDLGKANKFIVRVLDKWDFSNPELLPANDDLKSEWIRFEFDTQIKKHLNII